jgi:RAVE protein 1 C terminal
LQFAKLDKNVMGGQLLSLLTQNDFTSEKGRNSLRKNAFALIRLHRYRHAAAVYLCAEPPMLKEASDVIHSYMHDPLLALFTCRVVEWRLGISNRVKQRIASSTSGEASEEDGFLLGPQSRRLLTMFIVPSLHESVSSITASRLTLS